MNTITIYLVDDHQMLIDGIKALIVDEPSFKIVGENTNPLAAKEEIIKLKPALVLTDINMPHMSGIELMRLLVPRLPDTQFICLSMFGEKGYIKEVLNAGAKGYILKNTGKIELIRAIKAVSVGFTYYSDEISEILSSSDTTPHDDITLTQREIEIVECIAHELSNAEMGEKLFISERTVETHRKNIYRKTGCKSPIGLVKFALEKGFIK
jgi:two-component system, NarL family, nitrate/nitrite response regulator NarL